MGNKQEIFERVYDLVRQIPRGMVVTYGDIAKALNINPRYVGYILHHNPYPRGVPCHRVVSASGMVAKTFAFGGGDAQEKMLSDEGIVFSNSRIELNKYRFVY